MPATEEDVGITRFATTTPGFTGILKHRYQDFQVFEVDLQGQVARMCTGDSTPPAPPPAPPARGAATPPTAETIAAVAEEFGAVAGAANAELLRQLLCRIRVHKLAASATTPDAAAAAAAPTAAPAAAAAPGDAALSGARPQAPLPLHVLLEPVADRQARKAIHEFLRSDARLPRLTTDTATAATASPGGGGGGSGSGGGGGGGGAAPVAAAAQQAPATRIVVALAGHEPKAPQGRQAQSGGGRGGGRGAGQKRRRDERGWDAPSGGGGRASKHTRFVMCKENMDTIGAVGLLARMLHMQPSSFGFAGTKDKRAVTAQWVTAFRVTPERLASLNPGLRGVKLGGFSTNVDSALQLGQLSGNRFQIFMRGVAGADEATVAAACAALAARGFVNYYGLQRFGNGSVPTHRVGALLLRGEWREAVRAVMAGSPDERAEFTAARRAFLDTGDAKAALAVLPRFMTAERAVLGALAGPGGGASSNHVNALRAVPRTLRLMYLHSYQSWLWNEAASVRLDLAAAASASDPAAMPPALEGDLVLPQRQPPDGAGAGSGAGSGRTAGERAAAVHVVTAAEAAARAYTLADVVLPLPGPAVLYPRNPAGEVYRRLAAADGVSLEAAPHGVREFGWDAVGGGDYRPLVALPRGFEWRLVRYGHPDAELPELQTDLQRLTAAAAGAAAGQAAAAESTSGAAPGEAPAPPSAVASASARGEADATQGDAAAGGGSAGAGAADARDGGEAIGGGGDELTKGSTSKAAHRAMSAAAAATQSEREGSGGGGEGGEGAGAPKGEGADGEAAAAGAQLGGDPGREYVEADGDAM